MKVNSRIQQRVLKTYIPVKVTMPTYCAVVVEAFDVISCKNRRASPQCLAEPAPRVHDPVPPKARDIYGRRLPTTRANGPRTVLARLVRCVTAPGELPRQSLPCRISKPHQLHRRKQ